MPIVRLRGQVANVDVRDNDALFSASLAVDEMVSRQAQERVEKGVTLDPNGAQTVPLKMRTAIEPSRIAR